MAAEANWVREHIRDIADYPRPGVTFRDITPLLGNPAAEGGGVAEQRRDVAERDAWAWIVSDVADVLANPVRLGCHEPRLPSNRVFLAMGLSAASSCVDAVDARATSPPVRGNPRRRPRSDRRPRRPR